MQKLLVSLLITKFTSRKFWAGMIFAAGLASQGQYEFAAWVIIAYIATQGVADMAAPLLEKLPGTLPANRETKLPKVEE